MTDDDDWQRLIEALDGWTSASATAAGRIEVSLPDDRGGGQAVIVMSQDEWDDMVGVMWGSFADAVSDVKRSLQRLQPHERFAVYSQYRLEGSTTPTLPSTPGPAPEAGGEWGTLDREGRVTSRFSEWSDPTEPAGCAGARSAPSGPRAAGGAGAPSSRTPTAAREKKPRPPDE